MTHLLHPKQIRFPLARGISSIPVSLQVNKHDPLYGVFHVSLPHLQQQLLLAGPVSKYGRSELDALVVDTKGKAVDKNQRSFEAMWWLVRMFSTQGVVSLWDGVGTVSTAAILAGRDVIALEPSHDKYTAATARMSNLIRREKLVADHFGGDTQAGEDIVCLVKLRHV